MELQKIIESGSNVSFQITADELKKFVLEMINIQKENSPLEGDKMLISIDEACSMLNSVRSTLWLWEKKGILIPSSRIGKRVMYRKSDIIDFMMGRKSV